MTATMIYSTATKFMLLLLILLATTTIAIIATIVVVAAVATDTGVYKNKPPFVCRFFY